VAGRLEEGRRGPRLRDASGSVELEGLSPEGATSGDWVSGILSPGAGGGFRLEATVIHAPRLGPSPDPGLADRLEVLALRSEVIAAARAYFREEGFLEVETPARVPCPGLEPHLRAFPAGGSPPLWLITSPELHLKRLLAAGAERLVEFSRAFRDDERGPLHRPEFLLLEWYRAFAPLEALEQDCERLVSACARAVVGSAVEGCDLNPPFERTTVREAVLEHADLDLARLRDPTRLAEALHGRGVESPAESGWDELFFRLWIERVEPRLGLARPVFVRDYPASQAALARVRPDPKWPVAERFELYAGGIELANAFHELNDPEEQRRRHEADRAARREAGAEVHPLDESFLAALRSGMPPASGIAFGLDRLVLLLTGADTLDELHPF
jgi:lysyl-tRNA synthetase class 2